MKGIALALVSAALFGASTPLCKALLPAAPGPFTLAGLLYLGAALAMAPLLVRELRSGVRPRALGARNRLLKQRLAGVDRGGAGPRRVRLLGSRQSPDRALGGPASPAPTRPGVG
jgi:hypothetical protein